MQQNQSVASKLLDPITLPLHGSRLIEASAGTGKTFTIALLYVRLVLGHKLPQSCSYAKGLLPPNVLVVTFTEAATKELRDRIRKRLAQAAEIFGEEPGANSERAKDAEMLYKIREDYAPADWPACRHQLLLAVEWMDEAAVSTIHSFCNRMLSEHAFDSGSLFQLNLETDQSELLQQVVEDYWRTFVYPLREIPAAAFTQYWKTPDKLRSAIRPLLSDAQSLRETSEPPASTLSDISDKVLHLKTRWQACCDELNSLVQDALDKKVFDGRKLRRDWWASWFTKCQEWAASGDLLVPDLTDSARGKLCPDGIKEALKQETDLADHQAWALLEEACALANVLQERWADLVQHAVHWVAQRLEQEKRTRSEMGFDDLLAKLDEALQGPQGDKLADTIRKQFPVALIDEFQDTDPVQYSIFGRIYQGADSTQEENPNRGLLMIGDPKQAIYAFRGADIYTYLSARQSAQGRTYTLGRNFRSAKGMVDAVNGLFVAADKQQNQGAFLFGRGEQSQLPFQPVEANGTSSDWTIDGEAGTALTVWTLEATEQDKKGNPKPVSKEVCRATMAEACASEIARYLSLGQAGKAGFAKQDDDPEFKPVTPGDIAILVNNGTEAAAVRQALGQRHIKSVYLSDRDSVLKSAVAGEILYWLEAACEPRQLPRLRAALATPSLGQSYQSLHQLLTDEPTLEKQIDRFIGYQQLWQTQGVLPMLRRFLMDFHVPARLLQYADGERWLTDILHIAELLQEESQQLDGEHALVHHYMQMLQADEDNEHRSIRLESDAGLVKVITVHKSKGLEYPLVFLPFATSFRAEDGKRGFVKLHDADNQLQTILNPDSEQIEQADRERLGEDIRKIYVALTRARYATWVGTAAIANWQSSGLGYLINTGEQTLADNLQKLLGKQPIIEIRPVPEGGDEVYQPEAPPELGSAVTSHIAPAENWWIASYSAIDYRGKRGTGITYGELDNPQLQNALELLDDEEPARATEQAEKPQHSFHKGAGAGTFLHEVLEWCGNHGFAALTNNSEPLRQLLIKRCSTRGWDEWVEPLQEWILKILQQPLSLPVETDTEKAFSLSSLTSVKPELEFWFESCDVNTQVLDQRVTQYTLNRADRPQAYKETFNGMFKGFIDLLFECEGRYYVLDYKSNFLGADDKSYSRAAMADKVLNRRYDLQYVLYILALHRLLQARLPDYDYDQHLGGAIYYFIRGCDANTGGTFFDKPPRQLIESLDALFNGDAREGQAA